MQNKICCFSGHRPKSLPWRNDETSLKCEQIKIKLAQEIEQAILRGYDYFVCGMALGFDTLCAECVLDLKNKYPKIKLELALPCSDQTAKWLPKDIIRHNKICDKADIINIVSPLYTKTCMQERNRYMVDKSSLIITYCNGKTGGTLSTINYAKSCGLDIFNLYTNN